MGKQYGSLMQAEIAEAYDAMIQKIFIDSGKTTFANLKARLFDEGWAPISSRQKALFRGMAATSGLTVEKLFMLDQVNLALVLAARGQLNPVGFGCSYIAAWDAYTDDGNLVLGRNLDWFVPFAQFAPLVTVVVFKPNDGSQFVANVGYAGWVNTLTGFNNAGQFVELNSGMDVMGHTFYKDRSHYMNELLEMLFDSDSAAALERRLMMSRPEFANIVNVAGSNASASFENSPQRVLKRAPDDDGLMVATNNYLHPDWNIEVLESPSLSLTRHAHLVSQAKVNKGKINVEVLKAIMELPLQFANGTLASGATMYGPPSKLIPERTVYTVVAKLAEEKLWIRIPAQTPWQEIDYGFFFSN
jgi:hypothetical protein